MSSTSSALDEITRIEQPRKLGETINRYLSNCYTKRPAVAGAGFVEPTLAEWAHLVVEPSDSDSSHCHGKVFLGPQQAAGKGKLAALKEASPIVSAIVNCTNIFPNHHECDQSAGIDYCRIAVNDECGANILVYLDGAVKFIRYHVLRGGSVLVHCQMGVSRSATVVMAYLMRYWSMTREEAYVHVKERRPLVNPNPEFWEQLEVYSQRLKREKVCAEFDRRAIIAARSVVFDKEWAENSLVTYQTAGHVTNDPADLFQEITTKCDITEIVRVAVDFVFGRGVLNSDMSWLSALCASFRAVGVEPMPMIDDIFAEGSDFMEMWSGEVYPERIGKITKALSPTSV